MTITTFKAPARGDDTFAADFPVTAKTADYTLVEGDIGKEIEFDKSTAVTCNLLSAGSAGNGWNIILRNKGDGDLTVSPNGSDTIDGASSKVLEKGKWCWLRCYGAIWKIISECCDGGGGAASGYQMFRVEKAAGASVANIDLASCSSGGTAVSPEITGAVIPQSGVIRVTMLEGKVGDYGASLGLGVKVGNVSKFREFEGGTGIKHYAPLINCEVAKILCEGSYVSNISPAQVCFDIEKLQLPTGSNSVRVLMGDEAKAGTSGYHGKLWLDTDDDGVDAIFMVEIIPSS